MHGGTMRNATATGSPTRPSAPSSSSATSCFRSMTEARSGGHHPAPALSGCCSTSSSSTLPASNVTPQKRIMVRHGVGVEGRYTPGCSVVAEIRSTPERWRGGSSSRRRRSKSRTRSKGAASAAAAAGNETGPKNQAKTPSSTTRRRRRRASPHSAPASPSDVESSPEQQKAAADICGVVAVMRRFPRDVDTQILGCDELRAYSQDNRDNAVAIAVAGGIRTIVAAMERHLQCVSVVSYGTECLHNLAKTKCHRHFILQQGGLRVIVQAISTHSESFVVRSVGCETLAKILRGMEDRRDFDEAGGLQAMMKLLSSFSSDEQVLSGTYKVLKKVCYDPNWELFIWNGRQSRNEGESQEDAVNNGKDTDNEETDHDTELDQHISPPTRSQLHISTEEVIVSPTSSRDQGQDKQQDQEKQNLVLNTADFILSPNTPRQHDDSTSPGATSSPIQATVDPQEMLALLNAHPDDEAVLRRTYQTLKDRGYDPTKVLDSWGLGRGEGNAPLGVPVSPTSTTTSGSSSSSFRTQRTEESTPSPFDKNACIEDEIDFRHFISLTSKLETSFSLGTKKLRQRNPVHAAPGA